MDMDDDNGDLLPTDQELMVCSGCLEPNLPAAHFCRRCCAPLSFFSVVAPLERVYAWGWVANRIVTRSLGIRELLAAWLFFGSYVVIMPVFAMCVSRAGATGGERFLYFGPWWLLFAALLCRTHLNYFRIRKERKHNDPE